MNIRINPEQILKTMDALRELIRRYEADAAALATLGPEGPGPGLAEERLAEAVAFHELYLFYAGL